MNTERHITLFELNRLVREAIEDALPMEYWVEAELSECRESRGHCYMELIQKDEQTATPIAKASAKCWANKWLTIRPYFERTTGQQLHAGMKVLLQVYPQFHEAYGFSWIVTDIDPTYTLGDMARKRQEIIQKLKAEGVFDLQKELQLPVFCQRIAVISSQTAAGYGDFCNQLADNPYGFKFETQLFPAIMQGEGVEQSIISALEQIYDMPFDCVVIIRGGGATSDMSGFDTLALAENVANFPTPIITGIGHERDESILDMISHTRVKTPTAAAALLIDHLKGVLETIEGAQSMITHYVQQKLSIANSQLSIISEAIPRLFSIVKTRQEAKIDALYTRLPMLIERRLTSERHRLQLMDEKLKALDPTLLLARGYSITMHNGRAVKDASQLPPGAEIETRLAKGTIHSVIKSV
ncbi:exodeoxyribonuclease VII large subunit [Prevotella sp. khp1]|uniref:exodeoxyribonuclease VII large subunit n=1 Tax=Prevotellaceae TaxID=171552 RepID=UPI00088AD40F|nr:MULTISPECIES: exodeoxyribonuclease VII large subunit [Prevotellaceae]QVJ81805.1 exodeoxyribonuclease VII large subunit [Xylanibacter ruminicola]SDQ74761.1 exodeoxyribonuclease VII large subunit [Prevotella sp. khp1]